MFQSKVVRYSWGNMSCWYVQISHLGPSPTPLKEYQNVCELNRSTKQKKWQIQDFLDSEEVITSKGRHQSLIWPIVPESYMSMEKIKPKGCTSPAPHPNVCQSYTFLFKDKSENLIKAGAVDAGFHIKGLQMVEPRFPRQRRSNFRIGGTIKPFGTIVAKNCKKMKEIDPYLWVFYKYTTLAIMPILTS